MADPHGSGKWLKGTDRRRPHLGAISPTQLSLSARVESPSRPQSFPSPDMRHTSLSTSGLCLSLQL